MLTADLPPNWMERAVDRVQARTEVSLSFAGPVSDAGELSLDLFAGKSLGVLSGVTVKYDADLGGKSVALRRPIAVNDYFRSHRISHQYDRLIRAEGLRSLAASGLTNREIGNSLGLKLFTIKGYMKSIMAKLEAGTRLEAVVSARRAGVMP